MLIIPGWHRHQPVPGRILIGRAQRHYCQTRYRNGRDTSGPGQALGNRHANAHTGKGTRPVNDPNGAEIFNFHAVTGKNFIYQWQYLLGCLPVLPGRFTEYAVLQPERHGSRGRGSVD